MRRQGGLRSGDTARAGSQPERIDLEPYATPVGGSDKTILCSVR